MALVLLPSHDVLWVGEVNVGIDARSAGTSHGFVLTALLDRVRKRNASVSSFTKQPPA